MTQPLIGATPHPTRTAAVAALLCTLSLAAQAQSTGLASLSDWQALGDAVGHATTASLSTAAVESGETPLSAGSALIWFELEAALGHGVDLGSDSYEGSALHGSFLATAGTTLTFQWHLATQDADPGFADRAFVIVDGQVQTLGTAGAGPVAGRFSQTFRSGGAHTLSFGVVDVNDFSGVSTLSVEGWQVTAVPEPAALSLMGLGLAGLGGLARARRRRA